MKRSPEDRLLTALRERGIRSVRRVRLRENRRTVLSLSRDGRTLNAHICLATAPPHVLDRAAAFLAARPRSAAAKDAARRLLGCAHVARGLRRAEDKHRKRTWRREQRVARAARQRLVVEIGGAGCEATPGQRAWLKRLYAQINHTRFGGRLPRELPIRLSGRMRRRFGHVKYGYGPQHRRVVHEIALNLDLMLSGNERHLWDTMLHEMAHVEAWLDHGDGGHGVAWREIAERVGCDAHACTWLRIRRRGARHAEVTRVPRALEIAS